MQNLVVDAYWNREFAVSTACGGLEGIGQQTMPGEMSTPGKMCPPPLCRFARGRSAKTQDALPRGRAFRSSLPNLRRKSR